MTPAAFVGRGIEDACPMCGTSSLIYQFRRGETAYHQCRTCGLLVAEPKTWLPPGRPGDDMSDAAVEHALELAAAYRGRLLRSAVVAGATAGPSRAGLKTVAATSLEAGAGFDAIVVAGALERSGDPHALLQRVAAALAGDGVLVLLAPSTTSPEARSARVKWRALRSDALSYFSPDTLQSVATRSGFGDFLIFTEARRSEQPNARLATWFRSNTMLVARKVEPPQRRVLSVIVPVYNEAPTVERALRRVLEKTLAGIEIEVVVVENGSTDGSRAIVETFRAHPHVRLVTLPRARGKGFAVRAGLERASGEVLLIQDADLEYDVEDYDRLVAPLFALERNFVLGSRHDAAGSTWKMRYFDSEPTLTSVLNFGHVALTETFNRLYDQRLTDPFTMFKVFRRDCLYGLAFDCDRFDFDLEIVIKLLRKGYRPFEIPVNYRSRPFREGKKISLIRDPIDWLAAMIRFRRAPLFANLRPGLAGRDVDGRGENTNVS